jgi:hypothetical protein
MILAICVSSVIVVATIILMIKYEPIFLLLFIIAVMAFGVISSIESNVPTYSQAKYYTDVQNDEIIFNDFTIINQGQELNIPTHYYLKKDWINNWVFCDATLTIAYPDGKAYSYIYERTPDAPYISSGVVECK